MKVNVDGDIKEISLIYGIADNRATDWTWQTIVDVLGKNIDDDGNLIVSERDYNLLKKIEDELKKNNEFSFEISDMYDLKELYNKMVNENKEKMDMQNNKLAKIVNAEMKKQAVTEKQLEDKAQEIADRLHKEDGYPEIKVSPYFAYGKYGFYFEFNDEEGRLKQAKVDLGTKKECMEGLNNLYYKLADNPDWWLRRGKQASKKETKVKKQARAKYTQRQLKEMVADGVAIDITTWSTSDVYKLQKEEQLEPIGSSYGVYGPNGRLYRGKSGKLYAVTARNNTLDQLPW